jgi:hypothetical protein
MCRQLHLAVLFDCSERAGRHGIRVDLRLTVERPQTVRTFYSMSKAAAASRNRPDRRRRPDHDSRCVSTAELSVMTLHIITDAAGRAWSVIDHKIVDGRKKRSPAQATWERYLRPQHAPRRMLDRVCGRFLVPFPPRTKRPYSYF